MEQPPALVGRGLLVLPVNQELPVNQTAKRDMHLPTGARSYEPCAVL